MEDDFHQASLVRVKALKPAGSFLKRRKGAEHGFDLNQTGRQKFDARGDFSARGARALKTNLPRDHGLQRELDPRGDIAHEGYGAALARAFDRGLDGDAGSDAFEGDVRASAIGPLAHQGGNILVFGEDRMSRAEA